MCVCVCLGLCVSVCVCVCVCVCACVSDQYSFQGPHHFLWPTSLPDSLAQGHRTRSDLNSSNPQTKAFITRSHFEMFTFPKKNSQPHFSQKVTRFRRDDIEEKNKKIWSRFENCYEKHTYLNRKNVNHYVFQLFLAW